MSASPQPPRPPIPPTPPRGGSNVLAIVLLVLGLIMVSCFLSLWIGLRFLSHNLRVQVEEGGRGGKEVSINTPVGSLEVHKEVSEGQLGLPLYPDATRLKGEDSANISLNFGGEGNLRITVAKYETPDPVEKVVEFYKSRLGSEVTKFVEKSPEGKTVFEIKREKQEKVVAIKNFFGKTRIELVRVTHGREEGN